MKPFPLFAAAGIAGALATLAAAPVIAQVPPGCSELCAVSCIKPISIPDRWDDVTLIVGYNGGKNGNWANNGRLDQENFTDANGNSLWDPGETFIDKNLNGVFDSEAYDPMTTGYNADPTAGNLLAPAGDLGLAMTLHAGTPGDAPVQGQYFSIDLPPINRGTPVAGAVAYQSNFSACNPALVGPGDRIQTEPARMTTATNAAMVALIALDPNATWDPVSKQVTGSDYPPGESPRIVRLAVHDPRAALVAARTSLVATKLLAFFFEQITGPGQVQGHLLRTTGNGNTCVGAETSGGFVIACATPAAPATWGRIKNQYR